MKSKRKMAVQFLVAFAMLAGALLSPGVIFAQDTPPAETTPEETQATEEPTAEPTAIPTEIPIEIPTEIPTEAPTGDPTAVPSEETPTAEVTLTPSVTPTEEMLSAQAMVTLNEPTGVIYTRTPYYKWDELEDAVQYYLIVYQITQKGKIKLFDKTYSYSVCDDLGECKAKPSYTLPYGNLEWNVRGIYDDGGGSSEFNTTPGTFTVATTVPTLKDPNTTGYVNPPEFTWTEVVDATQYQIQIYNKSGTKVLDDATIVPSCADVDGVSICSYTPGDTFDYGWYKWRVRAYYGSTWRSYTSYLSFIVAPADISTDFDAYSAAWKKFAGSGWILGTVDGRSAYYTSGTSQVMTSLYNIYQYSDFEVTAEVKRDTMALGADGSYPASYIAVRMGSSKTSNYTWYTGYIFGYTNAGTYSIWRMDSGGKAVAIQPWTDIVDDGGSINEGDWNILKVSADGEDFEFAVNGTTVNTFTDDTYAKGFIGFEMYRPDSNVSKFSVDSIAFTDLSTTSLSVTSVSAEQAAANLAALSSGDSGSPEGYDGGSVSALATTPNPSEPVDTTVYTSQPTFKWNDTGDSRYYLYLAKITTGGIVKVSLRSIDAATYCEAGECAYKYPSTLSQNKYMWKIKSYDGTDTSAYSDPQYFSVGTTTPTAKLPYSTGYDNMPTFTWTEIIDATKYNIVVYDSDGIKVVNLWPDASGITCDSDGICSLELEDYSSVEDPNWITPDYLENGKYKWRVRAFHNAAWRVYSAYRDFTVASDFSSDFESNSTGWSRLWGGSWSRSNGVYYTYGSSNVMTTARYAYLYDDFTFTATVKRAGSADQLKSSYPASYIAVRMSSSHTSDLQWYSGYIFGYTNAGYYSVWRMKSNGTAVAIQPWTEISGTFYPGEWNKLAVTADGSDFEFFINEESVLTFTDDNDSRGYVGFEMYRPGSSSFKFEVDEAKIDLLGTLSLSVLSAQGETVGITAEQQALNEAALASGNNWSMEGTPLE